jgi:hypothetical protein
VNAVGGIATFSTLAINNAGNGYTLVATSAGLTSATSTSFNVNQYKLIVTTQPGNGTGGSALSSQPVVTIEDHLGNTITTSSASITLVRTSGTGTSTATLSCAANTVAATAGVASFTACAIDKVGSNYTLTATATGITSATSSTFNVTLGAAAKLAFTATPTATAHTSPLATQPAVTIQDAGGNTVTTSSATITLAIGTNPAAGTLTCNNDPVNAATGTASFSGCSISTAGNGYTLTATSPGLSPVTTTAFNIT